MSEVVGFNSPYRQELERKILWKVDRRILPPVFILLLLSFLDRANVGNARIAGLEKDLHLHGTQFNTSLAVFFIPYILSEIPSNIVMKKFKANRWIGFLVAAWGLVTTLTGLVHNYTGLIGARVILGLCEGGLLPGIVLYLSFMYKRHELQTRLGIFYAAIPLSGAFGGLLASAILKLDGVGKLAGWRWIFILEGIATVIAGVVIVFVLPADMASAKFLTDEEREYALMRLRQDSGPANFSSASSAVASVATISVQAESKQDIEQDTVDTVSVSSDVTANEGEEEFEWREFRRGFFDIQTWLSASGFFGVLVSLYSFSFFLPTLVAGLGYSGLQAQLHSVPPYAPAAVLTVAVAIVSDRLKLRGPIVLAFLPLSIIGYIISIASKTPTGRYVGAFFIAAGIYPSAPIILAIIPNNSGAHYKRATATAVQTTIANCSGLIATFAYTADQAPRYIRGHSITIAFVIFGWIMVGANVAYCWWENKARREGRRDGNIEKYRVLRASGKTKAPIGDRHPSFLFTL